MQFNLHNVIANPLTDIDVSTSEIWRRSLTFSSGEWIQIKAPSGKGKSTIIQILYGNRKDYSGDVVLDEKKIHSFNRNKWASLRQRHLSMIFQDLLLFNELTGWENILLKSRLTGYYDLDKIKTISDALSVTRLLDKPCGLMSFGEKQRISIVRALVQPFDWLLMDEPFSHLDLDNTKVACELIMDECENRKAGLILTSLNGGDFINYSRTVLL